MEYAVNDPAWDKPDSPPRAALERLIRGALLYPNHPAVVIFNYYAYFRDNASPGKYWVGKRGG